MSKCVEKLPHRTHKCNSADGLQVFLEDDGRYTGYCFACGTFVENPYEDKPAGYKPHVHVKTEAEIQEELADIWDLEARTLPDRKLKDIYLDYFGVKIGVSEVDGVSPHSVYFPYTKNGRLLGYKARTLNPKKFWAVGSIKGADMFGWDKAKLSGGKRLFITEGEFDAVALFQALKEKAKGTPYADTNPAVVSLSNGISGAVKQLTAMKDEIGRLFKEVVCVFDSDEAGKEGEKAVAKLFPEFMFATLPSKDANQCIIDGRANALTTAVLFQANRPKNTRLVSGASLHEKAKEAPQYGLSWPWKHVTKATRGIRFGETIYLGAGQKQGKSEVVNTLASHFIREHGLKVFLVKPEESNNKTYKLVAGKLAGKIFHDPNVEFDVDAYDAAGKEIGDKLTLLNLYQHVGWETLKDDIRAAAAEGCKVVMIDPITNLTNGKNAADANTILQEIAQELAAMALDLNIVIFIFCHLRNPDSGPPHERGGEVLSSQFAGSRAMARSCNYMFGLEGNRDPSLEPEQRNVRTLVLLEDREFGEVGRFGLYWDKATGLFNEI